MRAVKTSMASLVVAGVMLSVTAAAQAAPVPTNLAGVTTVLAIPDGFDPLTASARELDAAGFPPRPDAALDKHGFADWKRAVTSGATRVMPTLKTTTIAHGPSRRSGVDNATSGNWSGELLLNGATSYTNSSFYYLIGDYVVPVAEQPFNTCTGGWDYSSEWVGIDGWGTPDVLQAGVEADAYCNGSTKSAYYTAWYEWYPNYETAIGGFPITPGDDVFVEVWSTSNTAGHAYLINYNTNQTVNLSFSAPSGTHLIGNSAEWVVERPTVGGQLANLTNYLQDFFEGTYAYDFYGHQSTPGAPYSGVGAYPVTMTDSNGNGLSYPSLIGTSAIWFNDEGTAR